KLWDSSLQLFHPDAGAVSTGDDFVRWLAMLSNGGKAADADGTTTQVLSEWVLSSIASPQTPLLEAPFAFDAPPGVSGFIFPTRACRAVSSWFRRGRGHRWFNCFPGQRFGLGACVVTDPLRAGLPPRAAGSWHWMGFASTYFFVNPKEELAACFLTQLVSHRTYPLHDELVGGVHRCLL
ncbi:unnamed protein product, partial [Polarella glacialis]